MTIWASYATLIVAVGSALVACREQPKRNEPFGEQTSAAASTSSAQGTVPTARELEFIVRTLGGRDDETLPWIVAFHGLGDTPEDFSHLFDKLAVRAHVYLPRAPIAYGAGFDWFGARVSDQARLTAGIQARLPAVAGLIDRLAQTPNNTGSAVVTGFSQGGILSFAIAAADVPHVKVAVPIAGWLPQALAAAPTMPVIAFHGEADRVVPFGQTQEMMQTWLGHTNSSTVIELHEYPATQHTISAAMYKDWTNAMQQAIASVDR